ncbi:hypothetical protein A7U60_g6622 [Sanghuangporus baumii]|uniref:ELYS-like domain-containing protein n=1 Tax=Sanghuangporus baumii TaxID=108892 RepID=A0A9Q5N1I8_SANBA|nr:hypothetical protein A7U60_g6622 [Sanghuangporus baumii]
MSANQSGAPEERRENDDIAGRFSDKTEQLPWTQDVCNHILARRAAMSGQLFFDMLLRLGGIDNPASIYPPCDLLSLKVLIDAILDLSYDSMKRDCLVYYLLKQLQKGKEVSFAYERSISSHYVALTDAYWELDSGINLEGAISRLSDARIVKDHTTKIMETLALDSNSAFLIRKYVRTCNPALRELSDLERYIIATSEHSILDAWKYQRNFPINHPTRKALLRKILEWTLTPKPKAPAIKQLLAMPFARFEEAVLQDFAVHPPEDLPPPSIEAARGLVVIRLIQSCKFAAALRFDRQYPSSPVAPQGTWGAERGRIAKEILSIMSRSERDRLENEINALDADARIRSSLGANVNLSRSWASSSFGASRSTDLGGSWEDLGRRTTAAPRASFGGRVRASLANGSPTRPAARASAASPLPNRPPSEQPTIASQNGGAPIAAASPSHRLAGTTTDSPLSAARLHAQRAPASPKASGVPNGAQKESAARNRNAFFVVEESRTPSPVPLSARRSDAVPNASPKQTQTSSPTRLPTPPQEETDKPEQDQREESQTATPDEREEASSVTSEDNAGDETVIVESKGPGFTFFGVGIPALATRLTPSSGEGSPGTRRKYEGEGSESQRKKPRVSVPGAFVSDVDGDDDHEPETELPSPTSATVEKPHTQASSRRTPSRTVPTVRHNTRKRSASPEAATNKNTSRISIPGTLFEDDEDQYPNRPNGSTNARRAQQSGRIEEDSEEADSLAPLPSHLNARKKGVTPTASANDNLRTPRRGTRSVRGSSAEPDEPHQRVVPPSTGRPVRRSSRLQSVDISPTAEHFNKPDFKVKKDKEKEVRPKKATRTTGAGATATGRGSSKRR